jgi:hypothetical protein
MWTDGETKKLTVSFLHFANMPKTTENCVLRDMLYALCQGVHVWEFVDFLDTSVNEKYGITRNDFQETHKCSTE